MQFCSWIHLVLFLLKVWKMAPVTLLLALCIFISSVVGIPKNQFYTYGESAGDSVVPRNDDGSSPEITLGDGFFPYFGQDHTTLYVNNNGDISFAGPVSTFTPQFFPLTTGFSLIAPYWADIDTRGTGTVYYRETQDINLLRRARDDISRAFSVRFLPSLLFIATWDRVGYFNSHTDKIATFQCVLMTDGTLSYAMFLYADGEIQWTTGDSSGGSGGFGGTPAQVGFDAGDGQRFFSVPGSQTANIVNIDTTSNVGIPGVWLFQVNGDVVMECNENDDAPLSIVPRTGHMLGGTPINIRGPCVTTNDTVQCRFKGVERIVEAILLQSGNQIVATCVSPEFQEQGWKNLTVTIQSAGGRVRYNQSTSFYAVYLEDILDIQLGLRDLFVQPRINFDVTWRPESIVPTLSPTAYSVDLVLVQFNPDNGQWEDLEIIAEGISNNGNWLVEMPTVTIEEDEVIAIAIQVRVSQGSATSGVIEKLSRQIRRWSSILYYSLSKQLRAKCQEWCDTQPENIGQTILDEFDGCRACPPLLRQATLPNSGLIEDTFISHVLSNQFFHRGSDTCFRSREPSRSGYGQQCCYRDGILAVGPLAGGTVDRVAPTGSLSSYTGHFREDVVPFIYCCFGEFSDCNTYYTKRPSDNGDKYEPCPPAIIVGDPHIVTMDGVRYTFNGLGEYQLVRVGEDTFNLQGRMVRTTNPQGVMINATVFSAIAIKEGDSDVIQFQIGDIPGDPEALANGDFVSFVDVPLQELNGVAIRKETNILSARFDSGAYIEVREENGFFATLLVSLPDAWRGQTTGLMGNYNGNTTDDLTPPGGSPLPPSSGLREIHEMFGISWIISAPEDSLFAYPEGQDWASFYSPNFEPAYEITFSNPTLEQAANEMCGDDLFCRFDIATTENPMIGLSTLNGSLELEEIMNISQPVTCDPPCINGVCFATDSCSCSDGYSGDTCELPIVRECDGSPCVNGGTCEIRAGSYICTCPSDYSGVNCQNGSPRGVNVEVLVVMVTLLVAMLFAM